MLPHKPICWEFLHKRIDPFFRRKGKGDMGNPQNVACLCYEKMGIRIRIPIFLKTKSKPWNFQFFYQK